MARIQKEPDHEHFGGEITPRQFYQHLQRVDTFHLRHIVLPVIARGIRHSRSEAGISAIGSTTDLGVDTYRDIDILVCAKNARRYGRALREELRIALFSDDRLHVIETLLLTDDTTEEMWVQVARGGRLVGSIYEIVLPDSTYSWRDQLRHDRKHNLSFCQLKQP